MIAHRNFHQCIFCAAAVYNIGWGLFTVLKPGWFFGFSGMEPPRYPEIFACLGMVVGLYGVLYAAVAWKPEAGGLIAAVGLAGKVLGPIGMAVSIHSRAWPLKAGWLCVANDLIWWGPFAWYVWDYKKIRPRSPKAGDDD